MWTGYLNRTVYMPSGTFWSFYAIRKHDQFSKMIPACGAQEERDPKIAIYFYRDLLSTLSTPMHRCKARKGLIRPLRALQRSQGPYNLCARSTWTLMRHCCCWRVPRRSSAVPGTSVASAFLDRKYCPQALRTQPKGLAQQKWSLPHPGILETLFSLLITRPTGSSW